MVSREKKQMINLASKETCTGCTACVNVCVYNAIEIVQDCNGFLYPIINENECVGCGLCEKRCPVLSPLSFDNAITPRAFALWSVPDRTVSSSGGAFSAFARKILDNGGIYLELLLMKNCDVIILRLTNWKNCLLYEVVNMFKVNWTVFS